MIYTSPAFWKNNMGDTQTFAAAGYRTLWIAHWTTAAVPTVPAANWGGNGWTFWQYTSTGRWPGSPAASTSTATASPTSGGSPSASGRPRLASVATGRGPAGPIASPDSGHMDASGTATSATGQDETRPGPNALVDLVRASVIGDDEAVAGPFGVRRVTYADYTASGRSLVVHRGLHPRRGAAAVREHPHGIIGHGAPDDALPRGGPAAHPRRRAAATRRHARHLLRVRLDRRDQPARGRAQPPHPGRPRRPLRTCVAGSRSTSGRSCSSARSSTTATSCRGASRSPTSSTIHEDRGRAHRPRRSSAVELDRYADRPLKIGSFSAASNVTGIVSEHLRDLARCCTSTGRCRSWTSRPPRRTCGSRWTRCRRPARLQGRDVHQSPHKFIGGPGTPGVLVARRELFTNRVPSVPGGGTVAVRQPGRARLPRPTSSTARRAARRRSSSRSGRASCSSSRPRSASRRSASASTTSSDARSRRWAANPSIEILGSPDAERLSIVSFVVRHDGRYLHHNFVVALLNDLFGIQSRGGCSCAGPYGHRLLGIDIETLPRVRARDRARLRGDQARLGPGQLQLLHQRGGVRVHRSTRSTSWRATAGGCCPTTRFEPGDRPVAPPRAAARSRPL